MSLSQFCIKYKMLANNCTIHVCVGIWALIIEKKKKRPGEVGFRFIHFIFSYICILIFLIFVCCISKIICKKQSKGRTNRNWNKTSYRIFPEHCIDVLLVFTVNVNNNKHLNYLSGIKKLPSNNFPFTRKLIRWRRYMNTRPSLQQVKS